MLLCRCLLMRLPAGATCAGSAPCKLLEGYLTHQQKPAVVCQQSALEYNRVERAYGSKHPPTDGSVGGLWVTEELAPSMPPVKVAIVPGNGAGNVHRCNWYSWAREQLHAPPAVTATLQNMPDPVTARETIWLPFMRDQLGCDEHTIIVGHSSGAAAAMRFAQQYQVAGIALVSAYTTDQDDPTEAASGYFSRPWEWDLIKQNAGFILQFASDDDPFLPLEEQLEVAQELNAELHRFTDKGHFMNTQVPELVEALRPHIKHMLTSTAEEAPRQ